MSAKPDSVRVAAVGDLHVHLRVHHVNDIGHALGAEIIQKIRVVRMIDEWRVAPVFFSQVLRGSNITRRPVGQLRHLISLIDGPQQSETERRLQTRRQQPNPCQIF